MKGKLVLIAADQTVTETSLDAEPTLEEYQTMVGGYIEPVRAWWDHKPRIARVNEEGARLKLPYNPRASYLLAHPYTKQEIRGNMAIWIADESAKQLR